MSKARQTQAGRQPLIAVGATLWVCCAVVAGAVLGLFFGWQAGLAGLIVASAVVALILVWASRGMDERRQP